MNQHKTLVILGSGNVATHLALALKRKGYSVLQVYSRNLGNASLLAEKVDAQPIDKLSRVRDDADFYLIAVSDGAIESVARNIVASKGIVMHTSGTTPMEILRLPAIRRFGVFYPFQTFSRDRSVELSDVPVCVEASDPDVYESISRLAGLLSRRVVSMDTETRRWLHLCGVFACNFTNHILALTHKIADAVQIDFSLVEPLLAETVAKALNGNPAEWQTGPAARFDTATMEKHVEMLSGLNQELVTIYKELSLSIQNLNRSRHVQKF